MMMQSELDKFPLDVIEAALKDLEEQENGINTTN